ncbi:MAG: zinc ribbon domain-containing protein [Sarcina sp.]
MIDFLINATPIIVVVIIVLMFILLVSLTIWVYKDAKKRDNHPILWAALTLILNKALIGFILYLLVGRKQAKVDCENCGEKIDMFSKFCKFCGEVVSKNKDKEFEKSDNKFIINIVKAIAIVFLIFLVSIISFAAFQMITTSSESVEVEVSALSDNIKGYSILNIENKTGGKWSKRAYRSIDTGTMKYDIKDPKTEKILVRYSQDSGIAYIGISQENILEEINISNLNNYDDEPLEISLEKFKEGNIDVTVSIDAKKLKFHMEKSE